MNAAPRFIAAELGLHAKRAGAWKAVFFFFLSACALFPFTLAEPPGARVIQGVIWLLFLAAPALAASHAFDEEKRSGRLERHLTHTGALLPFLAKICVFWLLFFWPAALAGPALAAAAGAPFPSYGAATALFLCAGAAAAALCAFCGALAAGGGAQGAQGAVLLMPLFAPLWIFGTAGAADPSKTADAFTVIAAFFLLTAPLCALLGAHLLRQAAAEG